MKDEKQLFALSANFLQGPVNNLAKHEHLEPSDVVALLHIIMGRIAGRMGYRHMTCEQYWKELSVHGEALFKLGFQEERQDEN